MRCPCLSGDLLASCCGPLLAGAPAPTAERLMRSRYTAFAVADTAHLLRFWHPSRRPAALELDPAVRWTRLDVIDTVAGGPFDTAGEVEFVAYYRDEDGRGAMHERSRFVREDRTWLYLDGAAVPDPGRLVP